MSSSKGRRAASSKAVLRLLLQAHTQIPTLAKRAFDNVTKEEIDLQRIDLVGKEVDLHLLQHGKDSAQLVVRDAVLTLEGGGFHRWVIWTLPGRDFVCLEPWTAPGNALNTGEGLTVLGPGESRKLALSIRSRD